MVLVLYGLEIMPMIFNQLNHLVFLLMIFTQRPPLLPLTPVPARHSVFASLPTHLALSGFQPTAQRVNADASSGATSFAEPPLLYHHPLPLPRTPHHKRGGAALFAVFCNLFSSSLSPFLSLYLVSFCPSIQEGAGPSTPGRRTGGQKGRKGKIRLRRACKGCSYNRTLQAKRR